MKLRLERNKLLGDTTIGMLYVNGVFECYTLEDKVRNFKVYGQTAIPYGKYEVRITFSPKFQRMMHLLLNVPKFQGIRIHSGNTKEDTKGCILVGESTKGNVVYNSRVAYRKLYQKLEVAHNRGEKITIDIIAPDVRRAKRVGGLLLGSIVGIFGYRYYRKRQKRKALKHG